MESLNPEYHRLKTILNLAFIGLAILFLVLLFVFKGSMNTLINKKMKEQADVGIKIRIALLVDSAYNYQKNRKGFEITFLEFGATGCISCKMMERVMEEVKSQYHAKIKIIFVNILLPRNQELMKYFGVSLIPTQVLLNKSGNEIFRHSGYCSFDKLDKELKNIIN